MEEQEQSKLKNLIYSIVYSVMKQWRLVVALFILGMLIGAVCSMAVMVKSRGMNYEITASIAVAPTDAEGKHLGGSSYMTRDDYEIAEKMAEAAIYCLQSDDMAAAAIKNAGMEKYSVSTIKNNVSFAQYDETQIIQMNVNWSDGKGGVKLANAYIKAAETELPKQISTGQVSVVESPQFHYAPGKTRAVKWFGLLSAVGLLLGIGCALMGAFLKPTLLNSADMESIFGFSILGEIPKDKRKGESFQQAVESTAYILRSQIGDKKRILYFTSAERGEGRTLITAEIGKVLAGMQKRVLLLDLDFKNPSIGRYFTDSLIYDQTINALYHGDSTKEEAVIKVSPYLSVLPAILQRGMIPYDDTLFELLKEVTDGYDYVLIDAPPVGVASATLALNNFATGAVYVVAYDEASLAMIQKATDRLDKSGTQMIGCIVNKEVTLANVMQKEDRPHFPRFKKPEPIKEETAKEDQMIKDLTVQLPPKAKKEEEKDNWTSFEADEKTEKSVLDELWKEDKQ